MELALILTVVTFAFLVKAVVGFGGPLVGVPMLAPFIGVEHAVVALSIGNVVANLMLLWQNRRGAETIGPVLVRAVGAGVLGVAFGSYLLTELDDRLLSAALAVSVLGYIVLAVAKPDLHLSHERGLHISVPVGLAGGLLHGTTGNSGSVFGTFLHAMDLQRSEFVFAVTIPFLAFGTVQITTLAGLGSFTGPRTVEALLAVIPVVVVTPIGSRMGDRLASRTFSQLILALLAFSGLALLVSAISG